MGQVRGGSCSISGVEKPQVAGWWLCQHSAQLSHQGQAWEVVGFQQQRSLGGVAASVLAELGEGAQESRHSRDTQLVPSGTGEDPKPSPSYLDLRF